MRGGVISFEGTPMEDINFHPTRPLVYIAGPYTQGDPIVNTRRGMEAFEALRRLGAVPFCPHHSAFQQLVHPLTWNEWLEYDYQIVSRCDLIFRLHGPSTGADMEVNWAGQIGIPVFCEEEPITAWPDRFAPVKLPDDMVSYICMALADQ